MQPQVAVTAGLTLRVAAESVTADGRSGAAYAQAGLWYDALQQLSDRIDAAPNDRAAREVRNGLLRQAHLEASLE